MEETKIIYHIDEEPTPYLIKLSITPGKVTLEDFKVALNKPNFKYFFKSNDEDFGVVKEEISDDKKILPCFDGKIKAWLVPVEGSIIASDTQSDRFAHTNHEINSQSSKKKNNSEDVDNFSGASGDRLPPLKSFKNSKLNKYHQKIYDPSGGSSMLSSDIETTSFLDSEEESTRFSTATGASFNSKYAKFRRRVKRHKVKKFSKISEDESSMSSMTDSTMSLNIVSVTLQMDSVNFLGISIVGQSNKAGDGGIYVGSIMKDGAVARDGRIDPGDMILEVNGISFEDMSNDEAVMVLRKQVQIPGPITLVVAKCWDNDPKSYVCFPPQEPVKPVDPRAWVLHSNAFINENNLSICNDTLYNTQTGLNGDNKKAVNSESYNEILLDPSNRGLKANGHSQTLSSSNNYSVKQHLQTSQKAQSISNSSNGDKLLMNGQLMQNVSLANNPTSSILLQSINQLPTLSISSDTNLILVASQMPDSGLEIRDRVWLKIVIPSAFIGSDLVSWLFSKVEGFINRKDAKKYASDLLKYNHIQHIVKKNKFSEPCYYVFCQTIQELISTNPATFGFYKVSNMDMSGQMNPMNLTMTDSNGYTAAWPNCMKDVSFTHYPLGVEGSVKNFNQNDLNQLNSMGSSQVNSQIPVSSSQNFPSNHQRFSELTEEARLNLQSMGNQKSNLLNNSMNYPQASNFNQYFGHQNHQDHEINQNKGTPSNNGNNNFNLSSGTSSSSSDASNNNQSKNPANLGYNPSQYNQLSINNHTNGGPYSISSHSNSSQQNRLN